MSFKLEGRGFALVGLALAATVLMGNAAAAGPADRMMTPRPAQGEAHGRGDLSDLYRGPLGVLSGYRMASAVECRSNSDCAAGEICCVVSGLETYCATRDECFGKPMKE